MFNRREFLAITGLGGAAVLFGITNPSSDVERRKDCHARIC